VAELSTEYSWVSHMSDIPGELDTVRTSETQVLHSDISRSYEDIIETMKQNFVSNIPEGLLLQQQSYISSSGYFSKISDIMSK